MRSLIHKFKRSRPHQGGFTLIELMVTVAIVVLVTGIIMLQYSSFNSSVLLTSQAYQTAFDIREVQSLAISVRGENLFFYRAYGLFFDMLSGDPNEYLLFQDNPANGDQDPVEYQRGEEINVPYRLDARFKLVDICATNDTGRYCYADDPSTSDETVNPALHDLTISFVRPNFDAHFFSAAISNIKSVELHIGTNDNSKIKKVIISETGQISVQ